MSIIKIPNSLRLNLNSEKLFIIVDTNVFIKNLELIKILSTGNKIIGLDYYIIVCHVVLRELNGLQKGNKKAEIAYSFLQTILKNEASNRKLQFEYAEPDINLEILVSDDHLINLALKIRLDCPVVVCTFDNMLRLRCKNANVMEVRPERLRNELQTNIIHYKLIDCTDPTLKLFIELLNKDLKSVLISLFADHFQSKWGNVWRLMIPPEQNINFITLIEHLTLINNDLEIDSLINKLKLNDVSKFYKNYDEMSNLFDDICNVLEKLSVKREIKEFYEIKRFLKLRNRYTTYDDNVNIAKAQIMTSFAKIKNSNGDDLNIIQLQLSYLDLLEQFYKKIIQLEINTKLTIETKEILQLFVLLVDYLKQDGNSLFCVKHLLDYFNNENIRLNLTDNLKEIIELKIFVEQNYKKLFNKDDSNVMLTN